MATADDAEIMQWAVQNCRTVITLDDHFGDWSVLPLSRHPGVIRLKVNPTTTANTLGLLLPFLRRHQETDFDNRSSYQRLLSSGIFNDTVDHVIDGVVDRKKGVRYEDYRCQRPENQRGCVHRRGAG
jgi:predicted nuclease of predicted toxin-antitoxin system